MGEDSASGRQDLWLPLGFTQRDFLASVARLRSAGLIERIDHDLATGEGEVSFTPACLRLMQAGRNPFAEEGFVRAWLTGDAAAVRSWVESEAAALEDSTG
jgi:hypothetical protein